MSNGGEMEGGSEEVNPFMKGAETLTP